MTSYEDMDVVELRHAYTEALEKACGFAHELAQAWEAGDRAWAAGVFIAFKQADARVRRIKYVLQAGVVA